MYGFNALGCHAVAGDEMKEFTIKPEHKTELRVAQMRRTLGDRVQYGLDISRRAADYA